MMQEEVENRTCNLMISTTKMSGRGICSAALKAMKLMTEQARQPHGRQSVKKLIGQNKGVTNVDISKTDLKGFEKVARKYGVDYAIRKDSSREPPKYLCFFKAQDADALKSAMQEYMSGSLHKSKKPSILQTLKKFKELIASMPGKAKSRDRGERGL